MKKILSASMTFVPFLLISCIRPTDGRKENKEVMDRPRIVNIINFIRLCEPRIESYTEEVLYETVAKQVEMIKEYKLGGTFLLQYDALIDSRYQLLLKGLPADSFEIGAWWEIPQPLVEKAGFQWRGRFPWDWHADVGFSTGYSPAEREKLADIYMEDFKEIFGYYPKSVGSWFIDAHTLDYLSQKYGIVASCNCKDQIGTDGYTLWGGYWNQAYYPSKRNAYMPAQNRENQIPVPIFRMLGSDPIRQYDAGLGSPSQHVVSLEPVYPKGGGDPAWVHWYFDQFINGECMEFAYVQAGQENSFTWDRMSKGFGIQLPLIARLRDEKKIRVETLAESGRWFRENFATTPSTSVTVKEDLHGGTRRTVWFNSRFYRSNLLWENDTLRFRDIHVFDEDLASDYVDARGTSTQCQFYTLPFVDGFSWSSVSEVAGLRLKMVVNGKETLAEGGVPVISDSMRGKLIITWPLKSSEGVFVIELDENKTEMRMEGETSIDWFMELTTAGDAKLPFEKISPQEIHCRFKGMDYEVTVGRGLFSEPGHGIIFRIEPEDNVITLNLAQQKPNVEKRGAGL
ncbi:MAG: hypothetical protein OEW18_06360 [Candidatus Aminicenantes bacterium]|nr:hypothetical protein [Candidatus Aminicenantes bacterium]